MTFYLFIYLPQVVQYKTVPSGMKTIAQGRTLIKHDHDPGFNPPVPEKVGSKETVLLSQVQCLLKLLCYCQCGKVKTTFQYSFMFYVLMFYKLAWVSFKIFRILVYIYELCVYNLWKGSVSRQKINNGRPYVKEACYHKKDPIGVCRDNEQAGKLLLQQEQRQRRSVLAWELQQNEVLCTAYLLLLWDLSEEGGFGPWKRRCQIFPMEPKKWV